MKHLLEIFRSIIFFVFGSAIFFALLSISYNELLLDFKGVEAEIKVVKVDYGVICGSRKVKRTCNHFTLDIDGKSVVYSSDDTKLQESKLTYLDGKPHIFKMGERNKDPIFALAKKSFEFFPIFLFCLSLFAVVTGFYGIKTCFSKNTVRYSVLFSSLAISCYLGLNIQNFFA